MNATASRKTQLAAMPMMMESRTANIHKDKLSCIKHALLLS